MLIKKILPGLLLVLCSCQEAILHNLSESEANHLITRLHEAAIVSSKFREPDGKWGIEVPKASSLEAIKYLSDTRVIRHRHDEPKMNGSLVSSRDEQRFQFERSISREIESTLATVDGVLEARVHLNLPAVDPLFGRPLSSQARGSASVLLVLQEESYLNEEQVSSLVAGASGIESQFITVVLTPYRRVSEPVLDETSLEDSKAQLKVEQTEQGGAGKPNKLSISQLATLSSDSIGLLVCLLGLILLPVGLYWRSISKRSLLRISKSNNLEE